MESWLANFTNTIHFEMMIRLFLSAVLGGIVGMERGSGDRPAGFRTHILVCAGSALLMMVSLYGFDGFDKVPFEYPDRRDSGLLHKLSVALVFWVLEPFYMRVSQSAA